VAVASRTLLDVVRLSTTYLAEHGSTSPRLDAELLCAHALGLRRIDLYLQFDRPLRDDELSAIRALVRRRGQHEPVAYITGEREFYGRAFAVTRDVLIPRPDTETLVELALREIRAHATKATELRVADVGTGSGAIAVTLAAEVPELRVIATDTSAEALAVAAANAQRHEVADRVDLVHASWADGIAEAIDMVVSNPPYVTTAEVADAEPDVRDYEPHVALLGGDDGLDGYRQLLASLHGQMRPHGRLLFEVDPRTAADVAALIAGTFRGASTSVHEDLARNDRVVRAELP
jgi:release factor glutamine methyltransferase